MLSILICQASDQEIVDSLLKEISLAQHDTDRVNLLNKISFSYYPIDTKKGIEYAEQGLELAKKINWYKGFASANFSMAYNYWSNLDYTETLKYFNQALQIQNELNDTNAISNTLLVIYI